MDKHEIVLRKLRKSKKSLRETGEGLIYVMAN